MSLVHQARCRADAFWVKLDGTLFPGLIKPKIIGGFGRGHGPLQQKNDTCKNRKNEANKGQNQEEFHNTTNY